MAAGVFLRVRRAKQKGVFTWDEAAYYRESRAIVVLFNVVAKHFGELWKNRNNRDRSHADKIFNEYHGSSSFNYAYYKLLHYISIIISLKLFRQKDLAITIPALLTGSLTIIVSLLMGNYFFGVFAGIIAAALTAVSSLHVLHSRSAGPEAGMGFWFMALIFILMLHKSFFISGGMEYFLTPQSIALLCAAGVVMGCIILMHSFWVVFLPPMFIFSELMFALIDPVAGIYTIAAGSAAVLISCVLFILLMDLPFIVIVKIFPECGLMSHSAKMIDFLKFNIGRVNDMFRRSGDMGVKLSLRHRFLFYPELIAGTDGYPMLAAVIAGMVVLVCSNDPLKRYAGLQILVAMGFLTFVPWKAARGMMLFQPLMIWGAGLAVSVLSPVYAMPAVMLICAISTRESWRAGNLTSGIRRAKDYIYSRGEKNFLCTSAPFSQLYANDNMLFAVIYSFDVFRDCREYTNYIFVEHHKKFPMLYRDNYVELIEKYIEPEIQFEDPCVTYFPLFMEVEYLWPGRAFSDKKGVEKWNRFRSGPGESERYIKVYDTREFYKKIFEIPELEAEINRIYAWDKIREKNFSEAKEYLERAKPFISEEELGRMNKILSVNLVQETIRKANEYIVNEDLDSAVKLLKNSKKHYPEFQQAGYMLGVCYIKMGRTQWAEKMFDEIIQAQPDASNLETRVSALISKADILMEAQRYREASVHLEEALKIQPENINIKSRLGASYSFTDIGAAYRIFKSLENNTELSQDMNDKIRKFVNSYEVQNSSDENQDLNKAGNPETPEETI